MRQNRFANVFYKEVKTTTKLTDTVSSKRIQR